MNNIPTLVARVRLHAEPPGSSSRLIAFAELTIGEAFVIKGIRVFKPREPGGEPVVSFPAERGKSEGKWYDLAHPCTARARAAALKAILDEYAIVASRAFAGSNCSDAGTGKTEGGGLCADRSEK